MGFSINIWKLTIRFHMIDPDASDKKVTIGITISW